MTCLTVRFYFTPFCFVKAVLNYLVIDYLVMPLGPLATISGGGTNVGEANSNHDCRRGWVQWGY